MPDAPSGSLQLGQDGFGHLLGADFGLGAGFFGERRRADRAAQQVGRAKPSLEHRVDRRALERRPYPPGAHWDGQGVNFAVFSAQASAVGNTCTAP